MHYLFRYAQKSAKIKTKILYRTHAHLLLWAFIRNKYVRIVGEFEYCGAAWRPHLHEVATNYVRIVEIVFVDR